MLHEHANFDAGKTARQLLLEGDILDTPCPTCKGGCLDKAASPDDGPQPCPDCDGTGLKYHTLRHHCHLIHWAGNPPQECHGISWPPAPEAQLPSLLMALPDFRDIRRVTWLTYTASFYYNRGKSDRYAWQTGGTPAVAMVRALLLSMHTPRMGAGTL